MLPNISAPEAQASLHAPVGALRWYPAVAHWTADHLDLAAIALIVALQFVYFTGVVASDDLAYYGLVFQAQNHQAISDVAGNHFLPRFVYLAMVYMATLPLPGRPWAIVIPSLLAAIANLLLLRAFARAYMDWRVCVTPLLIFGLIPVNIVAASVGLPDMPATTFGLLALYLAAGPLLKPETRHSHARCLAAGLLIGAGLNIKEQMVFLLPGLLLFVLLCRTRSPWAWKRAACLVAGAGIWFSLATCLLWAWTGQALFHFEAVRISQRGFGETRLEPSIKAFLLHWSDYLRWMAIPPSDLTPMSLLIIPGIVYAFLRRTAVTNLLLCASLPGLVYLSMGSSELTGYHPLFHQSRYLLPYLPGLALLAAWLIKKASSDYPRLEPLVLVVLALMVAFSIIAPNRMAGRWCYAREFSAGYNLVRNHLTGHNSPPRVCAAGLTSRRFNLLPCWLDTPKIEVINSAPKTSAEWIDRYAGAHILVTRFDRVGTETKKHMHLTLHGPAMQSLNQFERVASYEPPRDRLSCLLACLRGAPVPKDTDRAVELYRVPVRQ